MVNLIDVTKSFKANNVLKGISVNLDPGTVTAIIGPNGSGKSTLIKCILGLCRNDGGLIEIGGIPVDGHGRHKSLIGYMPQAASFPENLTGREVIKLITDLRKDVVAPDFTLIEELQLEKELDKPVKTLSGGTRQKISATIAFAFGPKVLLLDEPTAGLDPVSSSILKDRIVQEKKKGALFVLTSHVLAEVDELADDLIYLLDGRIRFRGPIGQVKAETGELRLERAIAALSFQDQVVV